jgi:pimeloyl-ACP methyl ester carboxylesterase
MGINHVRRGTGEPLVLIHGIGHRWQAWSPVLDRLAERHQVIALDLPGFGASATPEPGEPQDVAGTVDRLADFFASLGLDRPHVAGNSLGGGIALEMAAGGLVRSATALSPIGFFTMPERLRALAILSSLRAGTFLPEPVIRQAMRSAAVRTLCFGSLVTHPRRLDPVRAAGDALALRRGRGFVPVARAVGGYRFTGAPAVPVTVGWGTNDRILGVKQALRAKRRLPGARHVALRGCGHVPMSDDPDLVADLILATTAVAGLPGPAI